MAKFSKYHLASAVVLVFLFGCISFADGGSRWLVERGAVAGTELEILWQYNLPMRNLENVAQMKVYGERLYVLTNQNYLTCVGSGDGMAFFSSFLASPGLPVAGLEMYDGQLMTTIGTKLIEIDPEFGTEKNSVPVAYGLTCPVVRNDSFFYLGGTDNRVHAIRADNRVPAFVAAAENDSAIASIIADNDSVIFGTEQGNIICMGTERPALKWQFDIEGKVVGAIARDGDSIYVAGESTNVYRIDIDSGKLVWKYQAEAVLNSGPVVSGNTVYQYVDQVGLTAVDKDNGKFKWQVAGGIGMLSQSGDITYVITNSGGLVAVDNLRSKQLYSMSLGGASKFVSNVVDSKIYIADDAGRLACLVPKQ